MLLINSLNGPFDFNTAEGLGANTACKVLEYIEKGKKKAENNLRNFLKGEISFDQVAKNEEFEALSKAYIPYSSIDEETETLNLRQGMAFASVYINAFDKDNDGAMTVEEAGPLGGLIDTIDQSGKITPGKYLSWLIFQDCSDVLNGVLSPNEISRSLLLVNNDPAFVVEKLREIYEGYKINELEKDFELPLPTARIN
ncbi:MAG: hypothetical protein A2039_00230 [Candidatus Melainabacteria bacterium GWA2_34_9]|nr:MAG: hypothetical protein A2039_00230 [Candidatus Melainabacteria bacterium GWA2_34_9]